MLYRRKTYRVRPEQVGPFTAFFEEYLLPNQLKHGARLIGRFVTEAQDEIVALWEYVDYAAYQLVQAAVAADPMHERAEAKRRELGPLFIDSREDFLTPTGHYMPPKQVVAVCACVTNADGEVLLVRTDWRSDTWEMPGGQVEENEALHAAVQREVLEETGLEIRVSGVTGVYNNAARGIVTVVFRGEVTGGDLRTSAETTAVGFHNPDAVDRLVTRPNFRSRLEDALQGVTVPYEAFNVRPYQLLERLC